MERSRVELLLFVIFLIIQTEAGLNPEKDSVCLKTVTYNETINITVHRSATKVDKITCLKQNKNCYEEILIDLKKPRVITRTKILPSCCEGYEEDNGGTQCVPVCPNGCGSGKCVAPGKCDCEPGFFGSVCEKVCDEGRWGQNCQFDCNCSENEVCHKVVGCMCAPGWIGERCNITCPVGYYGLLCQEKCACTDNICNHATGKCSDSNEGVSNQKGINGEPEPKASDVGTAANQTPIELPKVQGVGSTDSTPKEKVTAIVSNIVGEVTPNPNHFNSVEEREKAEPGNPTTPALKLEPERFPKTPATFGARGSTQRIDVLKALTENITALGENILHANDLLKPAGDTAVGSAQSSRVSNFIPTLSVLSGVCAVIILIAGKWLLVAFRRKIKKIANVESGYSDEELNILSREKLNWENNLENLVYVADIVNAVPTLQTFKPQATETGNVATEKKTCRLAE